MKSELFDSIRQYQPTQKEKKTEKCFYLAITFSSLHQPWKFFFISLNFILSLSAIKPMCGKEQIVGLAIKKEYLCSWDRFQFSSYFVEFCHYATYFVYNFTFFPFACVHVCMSMRVFLCICMCTCARAPRLKLAIVLHCSCPLYSLRQCLSVKLRVWIWLVLLASLLWGSPFSPLRGWYWRWPSCQCSINVASGNPNQVLTLTQQIL